MPRGLLIFVAVLGAIVLFLVLLNLLGIDIKAR